MVEPREGDDVTNIGDVAKRNQAGSSAKRETRSNERTSTKPTERSDHVDSERGSEKNRGAVKLDCNAANAPSTSQNKGEEDKFNIPNTWLPSRPGDWEVHVAGIRHRRQVLSFKEHVHGERTHLVLSTCENDPQTGETTHQVPGKRSTSEFGQQDGARGSGSGSQQQQEQPDYAELQAIHTDAMSRCLDIYGNGDIYNAVGKLLTIEKLRQAKKDIEKLVPPSNSYGSDYAQTRCLIEALEVKLPDPANMLVVAHKLRQEGHQDSFSSAPAAVLHGADFNTGQEWPVRQVPPKRCITLPPVVRICMKSYKYDDEMADPRWDDDYENSRDFDALMFEDIDECFKILNSRANKTADDVRMAILMSQHPRLGWCSLLQLLPTPILAQIIEKAEISKEVCEVCMGKMKYQPYYEIEYDNEIAEWKFLTKLGDSDEELDSYGEGEREWGDEFEDEKEHDSGYW